MIQRSKYLFHGIIFDIISTLKGKDKTTFYFGPKWGFYVFGKVFRLKRPSYMHPMCFLRPYLIRNKNSFCGSEHNF